MWQTPRQTPRAVLVREVVWQKRFQKVAGTVVRARVREARVVHVEHAVVLVLAIVAADVDHGVARVEVPVVAYERGVRTGSALSAPPRRDEQAAQRGFCMLPAARRLLTLVKSGGKGRGPSLRASYP